jgi:hypothetical protein
MRWIGNFLRKRTAPGWFVSVILPSLMPVFVRIIIELENGSQYVEDYIDASDMLYVGLSVCVANFSFLTTESKHIHKPAAVYLSLTIMTLLSVCLGLVHGQRSLRTNFRIAIALLVLIALVINFIIVKYSKVKSSRKK